MNRHEFFQRVGIGIGAILLTHCTTGCAGQSTTDPTPNAGRTIDFTLDLNDKANENLTVKGGYVVVSDVIVAQTKDGQWVAVSANCTHQGTQLVYKAQEGQFYCPLHLSRFDATGKVLTGPATQALQPYIVVADATTGLLRVHS